MTQCPLHQMFAALLEAPLLHRPLEVLIPHMDPLLEPLTKVFYIVICR